MGRIAGVTAEETRQRLLSSAARLFADRGYERSTIADIARDAGLSSGAIYAHYRSKADLLAEAIRSRSTDAVARMFRADPDLSMPDVLFNLGAGLSHRQRRHSALLIEAVAAARRDPELASALATDFGANEERLTKALLAAQDRGELHPHAQPAVIARFSLMLGLGAAMTRVLGLPPLDDDEWARFMNGLTRGLRTTRSSPTEPADPTDPTEPHRAPSDDRPEPRSTPKGATP